MKRIKVLCKTFLIWLREGLVPNVSCFDLAADIDLSRWIE